MISSFLAIGDRKKAQVNFVKVSVRHTIEEVYENLLMLYDLFDINILGQDFLLLADRLLLKRVFRIILVNAHEAESKRLLVNLEQNDGTITITDDGVGMTDEQIKEAFAIFKTQHKSIKGKGIGLAVARRLILLHGGDISLQSKIGQGTTVKIQFPLLSTGV
jgi:signal transduction histidine kinase